MWYKRKEGRSILKSVLTAFILGVLIIVCGGAVVGIGIKTWINNDFYSFVSNIVGTVHKNYPEIEEQVMSSLTQVLAWVGIAIVVILLSGIQIGEILSDWNSQRYHSFVGEIASNLANKNRQDNQEVEKFIRVVLELEYTNNGDSILKEYGYDYQDFTYRGRTVVILAGMMAITPLAMYLIILYLYMHLR